jgi:subtilisin family serine protease
MSVRRVTQLMSLSMAAIVMASAAADVSVRASATPAAQAGRVDVLVLFDTDPGAAGVDEVRRLGGDIKHAYRIVPAVAASLPGPAVEALRRNPRVIAVDPDAEITALDLELDNAWGVKHVGAGTVHAAGNKGAGVAVAVLDTGIDYDHPDLDANYLDGYDFVNGDADPIDDNGHGTHVAGTIAAEDDDVASSVVGVAPQARLIALKVLGASGTGSFSDVVAALDWLVQF